MMVAAIQVPVTRQVIAIRGRMLIVLFFSIVVEDYGALFRSQRICVMRSRANFRGTPPGRM